MNLYKELCDAAGTQNVLADEPMNSECTCR